MQKPFGILEERAYTACLSLSFYVDITLSDTQRTQPTYCFDFPEEKLKWYTNPA
jgi:hypothetical protein